MENGFIESFNGKLRDECLNFEVFFSAEDAGKSLNTGGSTVTIFGRTARWQIGLRPSLPASCALFPTRIVNTQSRLRRCPIVGGRSLTQWATAEFDQRHGA